MNRGMVVVLGAVLSVVAPPGPLAGQARAPLIVAYMTSDGELVPIARYDGTAWSNTWPEPIEHDAPLPVRTVGEIPRAWLGQPVPSRWSAWSATGKQQPVTVTGVDRDGSCVQAITLATSIKPDAASEGLAFDRPTTVDAIVELGQGSPEPDLFRLVARLFRTAVTKGVLPGRGDESGELGAKVVALARTERFAEDDVFVQNVFRDPRAPVFFIEAERHFEGISTDTHFDALSYRGWFRRERSGSGALVPISASVTAFSTAEGRLPRYTPLGILRHGGSIWAMSEWGIESQTVVLFEISAKGVRKLTSADISGC